MNPIDDPRFTLVPSERFRERFGPVARDAVYSSKKLCLVATDAKFLIELLYGISLRQDCFYVKYGTISRDGMYLGRCSLVSDEAVSRLCQELKGHPRVMVSLQDDAWFDAFRDEAVANGSFGVWDDWVEHEAEVAALVEAAFRRPDEAQQVAMLRAAGAVTISLVAQIPPTERERERWPIVGHVLLSPVTIDGQAEPLGLGLAPLSVAPSHQGKGVGKRLVQAALQRAQLLGYQYVVVRGDPHYYARLGFVAASRFGLSYEGDASEPAFMALELTPAALAGTTGVVRYHDALSAPSQDPTRLVIRDLAHRDLEALLELYRHLHPTDAPAPASVRETWAELERQPAHVYLGGFLDGRLVCACNAAVIPNLTRGARPYALIENVVTHEQHRRRGIGAAVMRALMARCWSRDCYRIMLLSGASRTEGHHFYQALGFDGASKQAFCATPPQV